MLATGGLVARAVAFIAIPFITRLYTPYDLGVLAVFVSLTALMAPNATLRYTSAIPLPKRDSTATLLFALCILLLTFISSLTFLVLFFFAPAILSIFSMNAISPYWWLLIVSIVGVGLYETLNDWAIREKAFKAIAATLIWQSTLSAIVKVGLGFWGIAPLGLLLGHVVSQTSGCTSLVIKFSQKLKQNRRHITIPRLIFVAKRYADFPKYRLPSQLLLAFSSNAPLLFSAAFFGQHTTGQLGLAFTALALPIQLVGKTTGQAYYGEIANIGPQHPEKILEITRSITKKLFLLSIPPFLLIILVGPQLFALVFGDTWHVAGNFARILAIYMVAQFISSPLTNALNIFAKQRILLKINIIRALLLLIVFGISYIWKLNDYQTISIYSILLAIHYTLISFTIFKVIKCEKA